jgi:hypothetical protein
METHETAHETRFSLSPQKTDLDGARQRVLLFLSSRGIQDGYAGEIVAALGAAYASAARCGIGQDIEVMVRVTGSDVVAFIADSGSGLHLGALHLDREHWSGRLNGRGLYLVTCYGGHVEVRDGIGDDQPTDE